MNAEHGCATPAVIYAAKSTEDKHGSIPTQVKDCRAMAEREGWEVVGVYQDEGFSAYSGNRGPELERAKAAAVCAAEESGECVLVVQHSDRLARGAGDAPGAADHMGEVWFWARRNRVRLRSVQDDSNFEDVIRAVLIGERNSEDSRRKSFACADGARRRVAERGRQQGMASYGYELVDSGERDFKGHPVYVLAIRADQAAVVRRIFAEYVGGVGGDAKIANRLNADGILSPRGKRFDKSQVSNVLRNAVYVGRVHLNGEVFDGRHEAIVPPDEWARAQRIRAARREATGGGRGALPAGRHLLTRGLLRCGSCGGAMSGRTFRHRDLEVYLCSTRRVTGGNELCQQPQVSRELIDGAVLRYFAACGVDEEATLARLREGADRRVAEARGQRERAEREHLRAAEGVERVRRYVREGRLDPDELDLAKADAQAAKAEAERLREQEQAAEAEAAQRDVDAEALSALARVRAVVAGRIDGSDVGVIRAALTEVFSSFVLRCADEVHRELQGLPLAAGEWFIEPVVRPDALIVTRVEDRPWDAVVERRRVALPLDGREGRDLW